jgi:hypothetical protein
MIYPYEIPDNVASHAEKTIFNQLYSVKDNYDIFYSRSFVGRAPKERKEYEIDFIIAEKPKRRGKCSAIFCLEVKGGIMEYNGERSEWTQNGIPLAKGPDKQASSASHSLIKRYPDLAKEVPIDWALCYPDCELPDNTPLPPNLDYNKIMDRRSSLYIDRALEKMFENTKSNNIKVGCNIHVYEAFKKELLRNVGFVETLSTQFKYEDKRFVELTDEQIHFFSHISSNPNILVTGYAGTGKTVVATSAAQEKLSQDKSVLFLCYNRTLANKIRYRFDKYDNKINVTTFHSLARQIIDEVDKDWWENNSKKDDDFWSLTVPVKLDSLIHLIDKKYDTIIIDEGQDFKELWFETIFKMSMDNGSKIIFSDQMQNIFDRNGVIPKQSQFFQYELQNNCRNTKKITSYLADTINKPISSHPKSPEGELVTEKVFKNKESLVNGLKSEISVLLKQHKILPEQILLMPNPPINESSICDLRKIGNYDMTALRKNGRLNNDKIHYASINVFKGLEIDILFIIDAHLNDDEKKLYTQISRGKNKVYIFRISS